MTYIERHVKDSRTGNNVCGLPIIKTPRLRASGKTLAIGVDKQWCRKCEQGAAQIMEGNTDSRI